MTRFILFQNQTGQTLIEVIIALGMIVTALVTILTLTFSGISSTRASLNQMIAIELAREGIEVARGVRDSNWLRDVDWQDGLIKSGGDNTAIPVFSPEQNVWTIDFQVNSISDSTARVFQRSNGLYLQSTETVSNTVATPFSRLLHIELKRIPSMAGEKLVVASRVRWQEKGRFRQVEVVQELFDWK